MTAAQLAYAAAAQAIRSTRNDGFVEEEIAAKKRTEVRFILGQLAADLWRKAGVRACRVCGCTEEDACDGGCSWAGSSLCSSCAPRPRKKKR